MFLITYCQPTDLVWWIFEEYHCFLVSSIPAKTVLVCIKVDGGDPSQYRRGPWHMAPRFLVKRCISSSLQNISELFSGVRKRMISVLIIVHGNNPLLVMCLKHWAKPRANQWGLNSNFKVFLAHYFGLYTVMEKQSSLTLFFPHSIPPLLTISQTIHIRVSILSNINFKMKYIPKLSYSLL